MSNSQGPHIEARVESTSKKASSTKFAIKMISNFFNKKRIKRHYNSMLLLGPILLFCVAP